MEQRIQFIHENTRHDCLMNLIKSIYDGTMTF